ncbi:unnamed protein product [Prorocentrum cordatum]|uniref:SWI/SNF-related matrix-associated actin-dependent regulator of chromatin subfamily A-like protein 1 n=1 Tax=Prorocentrum cordatum TaxID=2364126 RepID=A0ABN9XPM9_9DINO|nr:unnamed protein product [Polarella glacialis]
MGFTSFLFPVEQHAAVVSRLRGVLRLSEEAGGPAARLDPVPEPALRFAAQRSTLAHAGCPDEVDQLLARAMERAPRLRLLQPFQRDGVRRVLQLRGRCLLADEMGCGKTPQALAVLAAYEEWPVLVVCPASMRLAWAEEMERWLPELLRPRNIHVIFTSNDMLPQSRQPGSLGEVRVCIVSLTMARLLHENLSERRWTLAVVDESHSLRFAGGRPCTSTRACLALLAPVPRVLLLSGTPSASCYLDVFAQVDLLRPGLLGASLREFSRSYDEPVLSASGHLVPGRCRRSWQLASLLREAVMVRRRKCEVLSELPPKRRRVLRLAISSEASAGLTEADAAALTDYERIGLLKAQAAEGWLRDRISQCRQTGIKIVVFAHHIRVLDRVSSLAGSLDVPHIRIDGSTPPLLRQTLIARLRQRDQHGAALAVIGVTACAVGVDLSAASLAIFTEFPPDACWLSQAEDRLHRRGQCRSVDVVMLLAQKAVGRKRTWDGRWSRAAVARCCDADARRWQSLQRRVAEVSELHDGPGAVAAAAALLSGPSHGDGAGASAGAAESLEPRLTAAGRTEGDGKGADAGAAESLELRLAAAGRAKAEGDTEEFSFEMSPHTGRLHVHLGGEPIGVSLPVEAGQRNSARPGAVSARTSAGWRAGRRTRPARCPAGPHRRSSRAPSRASSCDGTPPRTATSRGRRRRHAARCASRTRAAGSAVGLSASGSQSPPTARPCCAWSASAPWTWPPPRRPSRSHRLPEAPLASGSPTAQPAPWTTTRTCSAPAPAARASSASAVAAVSGGSCSSWSGASANPAAWTARRSCRACWLPAARAAALHASRRRRPASRRTRSWPLGC